MAFRTKCKINGKPFNLLISTGNGTNLASETLVNELGLNVIELPNPRKLVSIYGAGDVLIEKQVEVCFSVNHSGGGVYEDRVLCNVVPMGAGDHILLGRPWLVDTRAIYHCGSNQYSLKVVGESIFLDDDGGGMEIRADGSRCMRSYSAF